MGAQNGNGAGTAILAEVKALSSKVDALMKHFGLGGSGGANGSTNTGGKGDGGNVAPVTEIRGKYGDPQIGRMPKNWHGPSYEDCMASECPPDFLDFYADFLDWKADNPREGKEKYAKYDRLNAARCRRWALEAREGRHRPKVRAVAAPPPPGETTWDQGNAPPSDDAMGPPPDAGAPPPFDDDCPF
jgi:hypothetical protein